MRIFKRSRVSSTGLRLAAVVGLAAVLGACHGTELAGVKNLDNIFLFYPAFTVR